MRVYSLAHHFLYHIDLAKNISLLFFLVISDVGCLFMFIGLVYFLCCQFLCFIFCFCIVAYFVLVYWFHLIQCKYFKQQFSHYPFSVVLFLILIVLTILLSVRIFKIMIFLFLSIPGFKRRSKNHDLTMVILGRFHILPYIWHQGQLFPSPCPCSSSLKSSP